jgi:hypothetical protein
MDRTGQNSRCDFARKGLSCCAVATVVALLLAGCSTAFKREWKQAKAVTAPQQGILGRWEGTWHSEANGHHGDLRCVVTKLWEDEYRFAYHATFWKVFSANYAITQKVRRVGDGFTMTGDADLGKLYGGVFTYEGRATSINFFSAYRTASDHGVFEMVRPVD